MSKAVEEKNGQFPYNILALAIAAVGVASYFVLPLYVTILSQLMVVLLLAVLVFIIGKAGEKIKSMKVLLYAFVLSLAYNLIYLFSDLLSVSQPYVLFVAADFIGLLTYFVFIEALYYIFKEVFIPVTSKKVVAITLVSIVIAVLFYQITSPIINSSNTMEVKIVSLIEPFIDLLLAISFALILILVHTPKFIRIYGWLITAVLFLLVSNVFSALISQGVVLIINETQIFTLLAILFTIQFVQLRNESILNF